MSDHIQKKDIIKTLSGRMKTDEETAGLWLEAVLDTLLYFIKKGKSITLKNFGGFYVRRKLEIYARTSSRVNSFDEKTLFFSCL